MTTKILVVDDDFAIRHLLAMGLEAEGYEVLLEESGAKVMQHLTDADVKLIILDIIMDEQEGMETVNKIRSQYPDFPVIMISSDPGYLDIAKDLGATATMHKPLDLKKLIPMIAKLLEG